MFTFFACVAETLLLHDLACLLSVPMDSSSGFPQLGSSRVASDPSLAARRCSVRLGKQPENLLEVGEGTDCCFLFCFLFSLLLIAFCVLLLFVHAGSSSVIFP